MIGIRVASPAGLCLTGTVRLGPVLGDTFRKRPTPPSPGLPASWRALVGVPFGPRVATLEPVVDATIVRLWREAFESGSARGILPPEGFGGSVVPAPMLGVWDMPGVRMADGLIWSDDREQMRAVLAEQGYVRPLTVACRQRYLRPLRLGERLTAQTTLESLSEPHSTAVGDGVFVGWRTDFADGAGGSVGSSSLALLRYRSATPA